MYMRNTQKTGLGSLMKTDGSKKVATICAP